MSKASRDKGARREREIVHAHLELGVTARRVPLSGASEGFPGDVLICLAGRQQPLVAECKARANGEGFATLERWLGRNDLMFLIRDRAEPMVVLSWATWAGLVKP